MVMLMKWLFVLKGNQLLRTKKTHSLENYLITMRFILESFILRNL